MATLLYTVEFVVLAQQRDFEKEFGIMYICYLSYTKLYGK